jgi:hypothetical protein
MCDAPTHRQGWNGQRRTETSLREKVSRCIDEETLAYSGVGLYKYSAIDSKSGNSTPVGDVNYCIVSQ